MVPFAFAAQLTLVTLQMYVDSKSLWTMRCSGGAAGKTIFDSMIYLVDLSNPHGTVTVFLRTMRMSLVMAP